MTFESALEFALEFAFGFGEDGGDVDILFILLSNKNMSEV